MPYEAKQAVAKKIQDLVSSINEEVENAKFLGLEVEIHIPSKQSLGSDQLSVAIFEKIIF